MAHLSLPSTSSGVTITPYVSAQPIIYRHLQRRDCCDNTSRLNPSLVTNRTLSITRRVPPPSPQRSRTSPQALRCVRRCAGSTRDRSACGERLHQSVTSSRPGPHVRRNRPDRRLQLAGHCPLVVAATRWSMLAAPWSLLMSETYTHAARFLALIAGRRKSHACWASGERTASEGRLAGVSTVGLVDVR